MGGVARSLMNEFLRKVIRIPPCLDLSPDPADTAKGGPLWKRPAVSVHLLCTLHSLAGARESPFRIADLSSSLSRPEQKSPDPHKPSKASSTIIHFGFRSVGVSLPSGRRERGLPPRARLPESGGPQARNPAPGNIRRDRPMARAPRRETTLSQQAASELLGHVLGVLHHPVERLGGHGVLKA